jgi:hypothetical protein
MLDFVNPAGAGRWSLSGRGETRIKGVPYNDLGAIIDYNAQVLLVQKLLSEFARDAAKDMKSH